MECVCMGMCMGCVCMERMYGVCVCAIDLCVRECVCVCVCVCCVCVCVICMTIMVMLSSPPQVNCVNILINKLQV